MQRRDFLATSIWQTQLWVKSLTRELKHIKQERKGEEWRISRKTLGPRRQLALFPKEMLWHANDQRQASSVKWLWIAPRGQRGDRATRLLEQRRVSVAGRVGSLFWELSRRLSWPGPTASHVLFVEAHMNYYVSFCYLSSWFITDRQLSLERSTTLRGPPPPLQMPSEAEGVRERESDRERIPALSPEKDGGGWTKTHCPWI